MSGFVKIGEDKFKVGFEFITMMDAENIYKKIVGNSMEFFDMLKPENFSNTVILVLLTHGIMTGNRQDGKPVAVDMIYVNNIMNKYVKSISATAKSIDEVQVSMKDVHQQLINIAADDLGLNFLKSPIV